MPKVYGNVCTTTEKPTTDKQTEDDNNKEIVFWLGWMALWET